MDAATAGDHWLRCRHHLGLQLPLPLSLILFGSSHSQGICNDSAGFCIRDGGRKVLKTAERSGSASKAGCWAGYTVTRWVCLYCSTWSWCVTTGCTQRGHWSNYWPLLYSGWGGSHELYDICNSISVQRRSGGGVLTLDCTVYGTPSLRWIPLVSWYGNASLRMRKLRIPCRPTLLLILMISKTSNISYDQSHLRVSALGRHIPI